VIVSTEYQDKLACLEQLWMDWVVDFEMEGFDYHRLEFEYWVRIRPQLHWGPPVMSEELVDKIMQRIKAMQKEKEQEAVSAFLDKLEACMRELEEEEERELGDHDGAEES